MVLAGSLIFFLIGLILGSFLNVVIFRLNTSKSILGRSACMNCRKKLCWYELIPLISFFGLRGRCLVCKSRISAQYPLVELATGIVFTFLYLKFSYLLTFNQLSFFAVFIYSAVVFSILVVAAVYDLKHKIIPDILALTLGVITFLGLFFFENNLFNFHLPSVWEFLSGLILALPFVLIWLFSRGRAMGLGDGKLAVGLGFFLGISKILPGLFIAVWSGTIVGIFLMLFSRKYGMKSEIPFAPFLVLGTFLAFIFNIDFFLFN